VSCDGANQVTKLLKISASDDKMYIFAEAHWFWVSASDIGHEPGQFYWADGHAVNSSLWEAKEPNSFGAGKETCTEINSRKFGKTELRDRNCASLNWNILCEVL
jgi:hypothetical protein